MANINWYPGHMAKTKRLIKENISKIDVVVEVIDARIPYSSKIIGIDEFVNGKSKVIIMSKKDLCDKSETDKWIKYYEEKGYKVILTDLIKENVTKKLVNVINEVMADKKQKRTDKGLMQRKTRVLIVGIPNAGKSTLINRIAHKKVTTTGNKPGVTKTLSWIRINEDLELLDTPGILWNKFENDTVGFNLASLTAIKETILPIDEVVIYILETLDKYYPNILKERYDVTLKEDVIETLEEIGKKRGCLIKGGEVDYEKVYTIIMNDIKSGYIKGITFDRI